MENTAAHSVVVGFAPAAEYATGRSGAIVAVPPDDPFSSWTFHVDGCRCSTEVHRTLGEAERCSQNVLKRAYAQAS